MALESVQPVPWVLPVAMPPMTTLDRVVEMMPDLVDKVEKYFDKKEEKEPV